MGNILRRISLLSLAFLVGCSSLHTRKPASLPPSTDNKPVQLIWPLAKHKISQEFKADSFRSHHDGIDIPAPQGTRIYAPADGQVTYAGQDSMGTAK